MPNPPISSFPKLNDPILMFSMLVDNTSLLNQGRLSLWSYEKGHIWQWICTSGIGQYQRIGGWSKQRGGVCPPNAKTTPKIGWYKLKPKIYHGTIVSEGFLITPNEITTTDGVMRSEIMLHEDKGNDGSYGCLVLPKEEYIHARDTILHTSTHLDSIKLGVIYTW